MGSKKIFLSSPTMNGMERTYVQEAFDTNWVAPLGKNVDEFERELSRYVGVGYGAALSSGTAALHMAVKLAGVGPGDVVLCSDLTFSATVNPVSYEGGRQVFVDSERETWNMDPKALEKAFAQYPGAKAVIVANLYGTPAKLDELRDICQAHGVPMIEDAAESLGATYQGQQTGTFGQYGVFSFNGNKIITSSGGGMLVSNDEKAIQKVKYWATQARQPAKHYQHTEVGYNYRMSNIVAGIGRGQLLTLSEHVQKKQNIYETYRQAFQGNYGISMNPFLKCSQPNFWLSCILLTEEMRATPTEIMEALEEQNIESRPIWKPMHLQPVFQGYDFVTCEEDRPVSEDIFNRGLCLPSDIKNSQADMNQIISIIKTTLGV